jgi:hypothetical protein
VSSSRAGLCKARRAVGILLPRNGIPASEFKRIASCSRARPRKVSSLAILGPDDERLFDPGADPFLDGEGLVRDLFWPCGAFDDPPGGARFFEVGLPSESVSSDFFDDLALGSASSWERGRRALALDGLLLPSSSGWDASLSSPCNLDQMRRKKSFPDP